MFGEQHYIREGYIYVLFADWTGIWKHKNIPKNKTSFSLPMSDADFFFTFQVLG